MLVRWITSPKHPQSIEGLKIARNNVIIVKKTISAEVATATNSLQTPLIIAVPRKASSKASSTPTALAVGSMNVSPRNL